MEQNATKKKTVCHCQCQHRSFGAYGYGQLKVHDLGLERKK